MRDTTDDITAFAELCARLSDPFERQSEILATRGISDEAWEALSERWTQRMRKDERLVATFERAFAAARSPRDAERSAPLDPEGTWTLVPDEAARRALLVPPLPFTPGAYAPPAPSSAAPTSSDETLLPFAPSAAPLPFIAAKPEKR